MTDSSPGPWPQLERLLAEQRQQFDRQIEPWLKTFAARGGRIFCARGCANCCTLAVHTTLIEARQIAGQLDAGQRANLQAYIERLRRQLGDLDTLKGYLRRHRQAIGPCPFLTDDGACGIYARRPFACRGLLSTRPADWCAVDFSTLDSWDRQLFEAGLDPAVVAWPSHYLAFPQEQAHRSEELLNQATLASCGLNLSGNLPVLVWLLQDHALAASVPDGPAEVARALTASGLNHPLLITLTVVEPSGADDAI